ncbi:MAG: hypothetical protein QOH38_40, partial [Thermoleophilaceae bacterium]|nr:hypothetical protein [Thermoleophilaceae bacterium]
MHHRLGRWRVRALPAALLLLAALTPAPAGAALMPANFELRPLATGLDFPTAVDWAPDGRMFVAEYSGVVRVVVGGQVLDKPLIDISDHVNASADRGLLGMAVDKDFASNHYLYLLYVYDPSGAHDQAKKSSRLTRVVVRPDNTVANPSDPETVILGHDAAEPCPAPSNELDCIPADYISHAIGTVRADPDGTLWVGSGDDAIAGQNDQAALRASNEQSYAGKLLHIDRSGNGLPGHPFCPADDDLTHVCTKVYARGFRNPFRFVLRGGGLGPIVGDVGMSSWDEIDLPAPGENDGWPCWEGSAKQPTWQNDSFCQSLYPGGNTPPYFAYAGNGGPSGGSNAVVGGPVYPGGDYPPAFDGAILFGDWSHGFIRRLKDTQNGPVVTGWISQAQVLDLQLAPSGNLAYVEAGDFGPGHGAVYEIDYCPDNCAPLARASATPSFGDPPLTVAFKGDASSDPDGDALSYDWDFGDGSAHRTAPNPTHKYVADGVYEAALTVRDPGGLTRTASLPISVGNSPPRPTIELPHQGALYTAGVPIELKGSAVDPEEGAVDPADLGWRVLLHHANHTHPLTVETGSTASATAPADHGMDSYMAVTLTARDSAGLTASRTIMVHPRPVTVKLKSSPAGAPLVWGSESVVAPFTATGADGQKTAVGAAVSFRRAGRTYAFDRWSDGGAAVHDIEVKSASPPKLTAYYRETG